MIHHEDRQSVRLLRLRHGKVNAIDIEFFADLMAALDAAEADDVQALVLTGTGRIFSAGVDLFRLIGDEPGYIDRFVPVLSGGLERLFAWPRPVVAAINGHAIAGGCILALACDHRLMAAGNSTIGVPELRVGVPFPAAPLEIARFAVSERHFQEVILRGRIYSPEEAVTLGMVNEIAAPEVLAERAVEVAMELAAIPAEAYALSKRQLRREALERIRTTAESFDAQVEALWRQPDSHEAIRRYLETNVGKRSR